MNINMNKRILCSAEHTDGTGEYTAAHRQRGGGGGNAQQKEWQRELQSQQRGVWTDRFLTKIQR